MKRTATAVRFVVAIFVVVFLAHANAQPSLAAIDAALRTAVERGDVPGVVALVTDREGVLYRGAFGVADVASKRPMAVDSMFRIASMTKAITSLALMQLVEQGKLGLEDPVDKYLPEMSKLPVFESFDAEHRRVSDSGRRRNRSRYGTSSRTRRGSAIRSRARPCATSSRARARPTPTARCSSSPASAGTTEPARTSSGGSSRRSPERSSRTTSSAHIFAPLKMTDTSYNIPQAKAARVVAAQQRDGEQMDGKIVLQSPQPALAVRCRSAAAD